MGFLGVDIGGTFTDLVYLGEGEGLKSTKVLTTVGDLTRGILAGIRKLGIEPGQLEGFLHGTTVALNALLEGKTPAVGLITTRGFRDVLEIMRTNRPNMYDLQQEKPAPLVPRFLRLEVDERIGPDGEVLRPLPLTGAAEAIDRLVAAGARSIAVCFLHAYVNSEHEERVGALIREKYPGLYVSLSSEVIREWREFERISTTALNAATKPIVDTYLGRLEQGLAEIGFAAEPLVMQLNGGVMSATVARQKPVATLTSGPVGGVTGARVFLPKAPAANTITLDIGGTSADIGIIDRGEPLLRAEGQIAGWPVLLPMMDIRSIGAGGGSIAYVDEGGALHVGPESAGASPGPACYGKGGKAPTATDANVLLGRINPDFFLGGEMRLEVAAAAAAVGEMAAELRLDLYRAAEGIITVLNANMARAITEVMAEKGFDPREFSLMAFGGAGGLHAGALVQELEMACFICPPQPGTLSALGILMSDVCHDFVRMLVAPIEGIEISLLEAAYEELEERGRKLLAREGFSGLRVSCERRAELRYRGQEYTLSLSLSRPVEGLQGIIERFHHEHGRLYGYRMAGTPVEIVKLHASVKAEVRKPELLWQGARLEGGLAERAYKGRRPVYMNGRFVDTAIYDRGKLRPGDRAAGPAVIEEFGATTLVLPEQTFGVEETLSLMVQ